MELHPLLRSYLTLEMAEAFLAIRDPKGPIVHRTVGIPEMAGCWSWWHARNAIRPAGQNRLATQLS